jgi:adenylate cyclase
MPKPPEPTTSPDQNRSGPAVRTQPVSRWNGRFTITITLVAAIGLLTLVSVGSVLGVGVWLAQKNTFALLSTNAHQVVSAEVNRIRQHLMPAEYQARFLAQQIEAGNIDPNDRERFGAMLTGALSAAPQIDRVIFIDKELRSFFARNSRQRGKTSLGVFDYSGEAIIEERMAKLRSGTNWGSAVWREDTNKTYLNVVHPVTLEGKFIGAIVAVVSVEELSDFVDDSGSNALGRPFVLAGRDHVLAHWLMASGYPGRTNEAPLPTLEGFADPVLSAIWQKQGRDRLLIKLPEGTKGHSLKFASQGYIFFYKEIQGFGPKPLIAGIYFLREDIGKEIRRMVISLGVGILALILSLIAAIYIGRKIARPIVRFSAAAGRIRDLDVSQVTDLPGSRLRELNDQSQSFNAMLRALRWFELYVPKKLVGQLVKRGDVQEMQSDTRNLTVMFTDIAGFSTISQDLSAPEVADLVNHHFTLVGACIEAEEGTVDKFIGDSVMACWGAPEKQKRRAERACRAALAIADAIREDNKKRESDGRPPIGMRIGIHTGDVTVGNIGTPGRINYTIIGDVVNIGERLEQLGKEVYPPGTDVSILISGDTAKELSDAFNPISAGKFKLKGRSGDVEVFKLL